jgi:hypothetical protein
MISVEYLYKDLDNCIFVATMRSPLEDYSAILYIYTYGVHSASGFSAIP